MTRAELLAKAKELLWTNEVVDLVLCEAAQLCRDRAKILQGVGGPFSLTIATERSYEALWLEKRIRALLPEPPDAR